jgi:hypothetical protein
MGGVSRVQGRDVGLHDMGQQGRADLAVGRPEHGAQGCGEAVHGPELGVGQGHAGKEAGQGHVRARAQVLPVGRGPAQGARGAGHAVAAQGIRQGARGMGHEGLQQLGQGVHARGGGLCGRQGQGQLRVHHRQARDHGRGAQAGLDAMFRGQEHGVGRDLGTRPGRGRHGDDGQGRAGQGHAPPHHLQIVEDVPGVGRQGGQGLARVDDASPAHGHDHVAAEPACLLCPGGHEGDFGLRTDGHGQHVVHDGLQPVPKPGAALRAAAGDQQAAPPKAGGAGGYLGSDPGPEEDVRGGKRERHVTSCMHASRAWPVRLLSADELVDSRLRGNVIWTGVCPPGVFFKPAGSRKGKKKSRVGWDAALLRS